MSENRTKLVCVAIRSTCVPHFTNIIHIHPNNPNNIKFINKTHESNKSNSINMLSNWSHSAAMYLDYFQREIHAKFWSSDQYHCIFYPFIHTENSVPFYYFFFQWPIAVCVFFSFLLLPKRLPISFVDAIARIPFLLEAQPTYLSNRLVFRLYSVYLSIYTVRLRWQSKWGLNVIHVRWNLNGLDQAIHCTKIALGCASWEIFMQAAFDMSWEQSKATKLYSRK